MTLGNGKTPTTDEIRSWAAFVPTTTVDMRWSAEAAAAFDRWLAHIKEDREEPVTMNTSTLDLPQLPDGHRWNISTEHYQAAGLLGGPRTGMKVRIERRSPDRRTRFEAFLDRLFGYPYKPIWATVESARAADDETDTVQRTIDRVHHRWQLTHTTDETKTLQPPTPQSLKDGVINWIARNDAGNWVGHCTCGWTSSAAATRKNIARAIVNEHVAEHQRDRAKNARPPRGGSGISEAVKSVTHLAPTGANATTPCCGHTPFELPVLDRLTIDDEKVTCTGRQRDGHDNIIINEPTCMACGQPRHSCPTGGRLLR